MAKKSVTEAQGHGIPGGFSRQHPVLSTRRIAVRTQICRIITRQNWKPNFDDTDLTQTTDGVVPYAHALVATERYRQIHWCNKKLYLEMMETLLQNYIYLSSVVRGNVNPKSRTNVERQIGQNRAQILKGLQHDQAVLTGSYGAGYASRVGPWKKDYGNIKGDTPASKTRGLLDVGQPVAKCSWRRAVPWKP